MTVFRLFGGDGCQLSLSVPLADDAVSNKSLLDIISLNINDRGKNLDVAEIKDWRCDKL